MSLEGWDVLPRTFFDRPVLDVAPALLGVVLAHQTGDGLVAAEIVEVEAYRGESDPASHAFRGKTSRNAVMFGEPGHAYVYFTYGMHFCVNLVCQRPGEAAAVLLRAGRIVAGAELAAARRGVSRGAVSQGVGSPGVGSPDGRSPDGRSPGGVQGRGSAAKRRPAAERELARGPARLCQALAIERAQNGADVSDRSSPLRVLALAGFSGPAAGAISSGPRVGVRLGAEDPWRFWLTGEPAVSPFRSHAPKRRPDSPS